MLLPQFPKFIKFNQIDKEEFQTITDQFPPYADFHFATIWVYNAEDYVLISSLNKNLVMKTKDYMTYQPFYTFIGTNDVSNTIKTLLAISEKESCMNTLQLIPEINVANDKNLFNEFLIEEDRDNFDYIYDLKKMSILEGSVYKKLRGWINNLLKNYPEIYVEELNINDDKMKQKILNLFEIWETNKNITREDSKDELTAINRLLKDNSYFNLTLLGVSYKNELLGFSISEGLSKQYSIMHFVKANTNYKGIFQFIYKETARILLKKGFTYLSREQDLGIPGLRQAKESWNPKFFLKKYTISSKELEKY